MITNLWAIQQSCRPSGVLAIDILLLIAWGALATLAGFDLWRNRKV